MVINLSMNLPSRFLNVVIVCWYFCHMFLPLSMMKKISSCKWPKEYDWILAFIHKVNSRGVPFCSPLKMSFSPPSILTFASSCAHQSKNNVNLVLSNVPKNLLVFFISSSPKIPL